jgi:hypothetical protein
MKKITKDIYAKVLEQESEVCFWHNGYLYYIYDHSNGGYNIDIYTNKNQWFDEKLEPVDGGVCEKCNEHESIQFMLDISE